MKALFPLVLCPHTLCFVLVLCRQVHLPFPVPGAVSVTCIIVGWFGAGKINVGGRKSMIQDGVWNRGGFLRGMVLDQGDMGLGEFINEPNFWIGRLDHSSHLAVPVPQAVPAGLVECNFDCRKFVAGRNLFL